MSDIVEIKAISELMEEFSKEIGKTHVAFIGQLGNGGVYTIRSNKNGIVMPVLFIKDAFKKPEDIRSVMNCKFYPILLIPIEKLSDEIQEQIKEAHGVEEK